MIKKSFVGLAVPRLEYESIESTPADTEKIPVPKKVTYLFKGEYDRKDGLLMKTGDKVKTCQKLTLFKKSDSYIISSVTGTVASIYPYKGDFGQSFTAVSVDVAEQEEKDEEFGNHIQSPTLESLKNFLKAAPGNPPLDAFCNPEKPIKTMVICGFDTDLLITANQYVLKSQKDAINRGISILKKVSGVGQVVIALTDSLMKDAGNIGGASGAELRAINPQYPNALPNLMMRDALGKVVPAGKSCEDMGVCFLCAEAVASVGNAVTTGKIPVTKTLTLIKKDLSKTLVEARIGTPVRDILNICGVTVKDRDRIIIGGPMRGASIFSEDYPVQADTDAIMVQDSEDVAMVTDYPCVNCGECIRVCPANIPVNMLVRFCEAGKYEDAADQYNLFSCIECGLCSFVCVSKMPVLQYIRLAKYELSRIMKENEEKEAAKNA